MIGKCGIKKWRISGKINVIACVNYLNFQRLQLAFNFLLIGLALAHEMLKSINMFEHDTSFRKILWWWLWSSGSNLISSTFAWFEPLLTFKGYCFFAFGVVRKWGNAKEWLRHWIPFIYLPFCFWFLLFSACHLAFQI